MCGDVRKLGRGGAILKALGAVRAGRVPVSVRSTLRGLTHFPVSRFSCYCKVLILNGEMSEWLKEHAWK